MDTDAMAGEAGRPGNPGERLPGYPARDKPVQKSLVAIGGLYQLAGLV
jgi:hypothetical protein